MKKFLQEFKAFALRGNVMDMAIGMLIGAGFSGIVTALVLFCLLKAVNKMLSLSHKKEEPAPAAPTTKKCPYCMSEIDIAATRCPHCTSLLETPAAE